MHRSWILLWMTWNFFFFFWSVEKPVQGDGEAVGLSFHILSSGPGGRLSNSDVGLKEVELLFML